MLYLSLLGWIVLCEGVGIIGGIATKESVNTWYRKLAKPTFNPPAGVFAPIWTILYLLMAVSAWLACLEPNSTPAAMVFLAQLTLNLMWSIMFFRNRNPKSAFVTLFILDLAIIATMGVFSVYSVMAAWILLPYLAWCLFATFLNEEIIRLNPKV